MDSTPILAGPTGTAVSPTVEQTIEDCIARYPRLFASRTDVLHHLFIVLGCGFHWVDGALVEDYCARQEDRISRAEAKEIAQRTARIDNPYPWSDLCNLAQMPEDVLPDWKAAADEVRAAIPGLATKEEASMPLLTDWIADPEGPHCSMRCLAGTDPTLVANRVAFIEKTPRVRVASFTDDLDDWKNWKQGPKGCAPEYGHYEPSRDWCDEQLVKLGYQLPDGPSGA